MPQPFEVLQADPGALAALTPPLHPLLGRLLALRGIADLPTAEAFLRPSLQTLPDPMQMADMGVAVRLVAEALAAHKVICIYGDYDADGISAAALLYELFAALGHPVRVFLPDRFRDGYGLHHARLQELCDEGVQLLISVDCGTTSVAEIGAVRARGCDFIVCDHHALGPTLPPANALLNPLRPDCRYADKSLSAVGIALVLAQALRRELAQRGREEKLALTSLIQLAALGTIADMAPMHGVNRILCWHGLRALGKSARPGIQALARRNPKVADISADRVGFHLAPHVNATGRMADPQTAFKLLTTLDPLEAAALAEQIDLDNNRRKEAQAQASGAALAAARAQAGREDAVVVAHADWHQGVVGIVANRLKDELRVPALVLAVCADGMARGSGRSIPGYDLVAGLHHVHDGGLLERFGGHAMAAGLTLRADRLETLRQRLQAHVAAVLPRTARDGTLRVDAELTVPELTLDLLDVLDELEPYGKGNERPHFLLRDVELHRPTVVGKNQDWCKATLLEPGPQPHWARKGVGLFSARALLTGFADSDRLDVIVRVERNAFRGRTEVQAGLVAVRRSEPTGHLA